MRDVAVILLALVAVAHADKVTRAVKKAGFAHATVIAKGDVWVVDVAPKRGENGFGHRLLVDPNRGRVIDTGAPPGSTKGSSYTVTVSPFYDHAPLLDVAVAESWSGGMSTGSQEAHYVVRAKPFALACSFSGSSSEAMMDSARSSEVVLAKVSDDPLSWTATTTYGGGATTTVTYTLGAKGTCTQR